MATFADLQTLVLSYLDDPDAGYFTLPQVKVWLNNAQRECQKQLIQAGENWYVTCATSNTILNQEFYSFPTDFLKVHKLEIQLSGASLTDPNAVWQTLTSSTIMEADATPNGAGQPVLYYWKKNCFGLRQIPSQVWPMRMLYSYRVTDMTVQAQIPDVPEQYQEYLAIIATLDGLLKDRREPSSMIQEKRKFYVDLMKQDSENRAVDFPRSVISLDDYGIGFLF